MLDDAEYCGHMPEISGARALVRPDDIYDLPLGERTLEAHFPFLPEEDSPRHPLTGELLGLGWHTFPVTDSKLLIPVRI